MSSFSLDRLGHAEAEVGYMGHPVTVETPMPPEIPRPKAKKRPYRYPEWRRKRDNRK